MLYENDIELVEKAVELGFRDQDSSNAWCRIKKFLEESCQLPTTHVKTQNSTTRDGEILAIANRLLNNVRNTGSPIAIAEVSRECGLRLKKLIST